MIEYFIEAFSLCSSLLLVQVLVFNMSTTPPDDILSQLPDLSSIHDLSIPLSTPLDIPLYINTHFPTESSLNSLPDFLTRLDNSLTTLDHQLANLILSHRQSSSQSASLLSATQDSIQTLQSSLSTLTTSAADTHNQISAALAPALPLYTALENLSSTSKALDALVSLEKAVTQLEAAASAQSLTTVASDVSVFEHVKNAQAFFDGLEKKEGPALKRLPQLRARAAVAYETLRSSLLSEFRRMSDVVSMAAEMPKEKVDDAVERLKMACAVAGAMGEEVRMEVVGSFVRGRRTAFRAAFEMDASGLAGVERRFAWLRKELRVNWARLGGERVDRGWGKVFPNDWGVAWRVADGVVQELRAWTEKTLDTGADRDVAAMVGALSKAKEFELELDRRFSRYGGDEVPSFVGAISESYGPWMGAYVNQEDEHLQVVLQELLREEKWVCEEGTVLRSATELFLIIKKSMKTCASLDIRQPLFSLHRVFKKHLGVYASSLIKHLPGVKGNALADSSSPKEYEIMVKRACAIINTAEYCASTVEQLERSLKKTVQEVFSGDIQLDAEREKFETVAAKGVQSIVALLEEDLEPELKELSRVDWANWKEVGDNSKYVGRIATKLTSSAELLVGLLSKHHFRYLLEKFVASFVPRYQAYIYECQQMNNFGAQQILLDASAVKTLLLGLPASVKAPVPGTFVKVINREMGKIEAMLKVILAPVNMSVDTYVALVPDGTAEHFQRVLEIRGLRRADAAPLVLDYSRRIGPEQRLKSQKVSSFAKRSEFSAPDHKLSVPSSRLAETTVTSVDSTQESKQGQGQSATVDSVKSLFGRLGTSLMDSGISGRLGQVSSQFESTTDRLKKEAAARGFRFGQ